MRRRRTQKGGVRVLLNEAASNPVQIVGIASAKSFGADPPAARQLPTGESQLGQIYANAVAPPGALSSGCGAVAWLRASWAVATTMTAIATPSPVQPPPLAVSVSANTTTPST